MTEVQTPRELLRSYKKSKILASHEPTRATNIPKTENPRGLVERFERGEIYRAYLRFREEISRGRASDADTSEIEVRLKDFRSKARVYEKKLDNLNEQFYRNHSIIHVEDSELGTTDNYVVSLDLNPPQEGQEDERVPYFVIPTYAANAHQVANFAISLALEGQKVHVMSIPENRATTDTTEKIDDWLSRVRKDGTLRLHAKLAEKIIDKMGIDRVNLVGTSMGAPIALTIASDQEFAGRINDLIIVEPPSIIGKNTLKFFADFVVGEGVPTMMDKEMAIKTRGPSERPELVKMKPRDAKVARVLAPILAKEQITPKTISEINPGGKFQFWVGEKSHITGESAMKALIQAKAERLAEHPNYTNLEIINFEGGHEFPFSRLGVGPIIVGPKFEDQTVIHFSSNQIDRNVAQSILSGRYN